MTAFKEKVVLVTGASKGIGAGIAKAFAKEGAYLSLVASGRGGPKEFDDVVQQCKELGAKDVLKICTDLSEKQAMEITIDITVRTFGVIHVLVNNAGIPHNGNIENLKLEEYDKVMKINTRTPLYLTQLSIPHLEKTKGNIINISSIGSTMSFFTSHLAYILSKAALDQLTRISALDLAKKGIRVNAVNPGACDTPLMEDVAQKFNKDWETFKNLAGEAHPLGRKLIKAEHVAEAVLFLASDKASMITGVTLPIDCGRLLTGK